MPDFVLTSAQEEIERSIYKVILAVCIDQGYTPNITNATTYPDTPAGWAKYKTDLATCKTNKGFAIEVFNNSAPDDKGIKQLPRIIILSESFMPGSVGLGNEFLYEEKPGNVFEKTQIISGFHSFSFKVALLAESAKQIRVLQSLLATALPLFGYITHYTDTTKYIYIENTTYGNLGRIDGGIIEQIYGYQIDNILLTNPKVISSSIKPLEELTLQVMDKDKGLMETFIISDPQD